MVWWLLGSRVAGGLLLLEAHPALSPSQVSLPQPCTVMPRAHLWVAGGRWVQDSVVLTKMPP